MSFWKKFVDNGKDDNLSSLQKELANSLAELSEEQQVEVTCIAGLLARVAYVDFELDPNELVEIKKILKQWTDYTDDLVELIANTAVKHIKDLAGLENHLYVYPLRDILDRDTRFKIVEALFAIAAADGNVENIESEEIRMINTGLELSNQHFIAARAKVIQKLGALKS
tara:strand:- start:178720 stop:179226 length:507 start_codon:yes stop_codon:yes gene_type:complete